MMRSRPHSSNAHPTARCAERSFRSTGRTVWAVLTAVLCALILAGCSDTSFVGKRVDNFTAYYNTFYNAQRSFDEGVEQVAERQQSEPVNMNRYINLFLTGDDGRSGGDGPFATAIEKSADVLREHPTSKWVDESLMLIGKSYYFQQNYVGAEQKFEEVQDLSTELRDEARFWLVRTLVSANRLLEAEEVSTAVLGAEDTSTWTAQTWLARGESLVRQARWGDAAQALSTGLSGDLPRELGARTAYLLGQVRETLDDPSGAQSAYRRAVNASNEYELTYAAKLSAVRVRGLNGEPEAAIDELRDMERDDKNFERLAALQVLRGRLLDEADRTEEAQTLLRDVLYGEPPAQSTVRGRAHYAMGELYRDAYEDFSRAAAHFDTASTSLEQVVTTREPVLLTPSAITNSASISERFSVVSNRAERVSRLDSLLALGQLSPDSLQARLLEIQEARLAEQEVQQERRSQQETARRFNTRTVTANRTNGQTAIAASGSGSFLLYDNPTRVQEGRRSFQRQWGNRPRVDNWRRSAAIEQQQIQTTDPDPTEAQEGGVPVAGAGPEDAVGTQVLIDVSEIPQTPDEQAAMRSDRALARYELATALFLNASHPDSAAVWYERVITDDADKPVAQQAIYALAEVRRSQDRDAEARERYIQLIREYPNSSYAQRARQRLGRAPIEVADSNAVAEATYAAAYRAWQGSRIDSARSEMARVARVYAESHVAPRAVLALATMSLNETRQVLVEAGVSPSTLRSRTQTEPSSTDTPADEPTGTVSSTSTVSPTPEAPGTRPDSPEMASPEAAADGRPDARFRADTTSDPTTSDSTTSETVVADSTIADSNDADSSRVSQRGNTDDSVSLTRAPARENQVESSQARRDERRGPDLDEETVRRLRERLSTRRPSDDFLKDFPAADSLVAVGRDRLRDELGQNESVSPTRTPSSSDAGSDSDSQSSDAQLDAQSQPATPRRGPGRTPPDSARGSSDIDPRTEAGGADSVSSSRQQPQRSQSQPSRTEPAQSKPQRSSLSGMRQTSRRAERPPQRAPTDTTQRSLRDEAESVRDRQQIGPAASDSTRDASADRLPGASTQRKAAPEDASSGGENSQERAGENVPSMPDSSPIADAYEPALNILAYLIARYPDAPQSTRALTLAIALAERHNVLPLSATPDDAEASRSEASPSSQMQDPDAQDQGAPRTETSSAETSDTESATRETPPADTARQGRANETAGRDEAGDGSE